MTRRIKFLFTLSIVLNVILIGLITGGMSRIYKHLSPERMLQSEIKALPEEAQVRLREAFQQSKGEMRALFKDMREARQAVRRSMNSDPFSRAEYDRAVTELNRVRQEMMALRAQKTGLIIENLNAEDRRKVAGHLLRGARRGGFGSSPQDTQSISPSYPQKVGSNRITRVQGVERDPAQVEEPIEKAVEPINPVILPMPDFDLEDAN